MNKSLNKNISIIVAIAENNAIGKENKLLWHLSDDLKRFKKLTSGHTVVMGRNTFLSLPNGPLPNRKNLVISNIPGEQFEGCTMAYSIVDGLEMVNGEKEVFIIGGGMIYKQFLPHASRIYLTVVHVDIDGDTFFPNINYDEWNEVHRERVESSEKNQYTHSFIILERK